MKKLLGAMLVPPLVAWGGGNKGCSQITFTVPMPEQGAARLGVAFALD